MEYLGITDQSVNVGLSKKISGGGDQQDVGALLVQWEFHRNVDVLFNLFFKTLERIGKRGLRQAEIVSNGVDLADDLVRILLAYPD